MAESCIAYLSLGFFSHIGFRRQFTEHCFEKKLMLSTKNTWDFDHIISPFKHLSFFDYVIRFWLGRFRLAQEQHLDGEIRDITPQFEGRYFSLFDDEPPISMPWLVMAATSPNAICSYDLIGTGWHHELVKDLKPHLSELVTIASMAALFGHVRLLRRFFNTFDPTPSMNEGIHEHDEASNLSTPEPSGDNDIPYFDFNSFNFSFQLPEQQHQPVPFAAGAGHTLCLDQILSLGSSTIAARDGVLRTPLHLATLHRHFPAVKLLLDNGADPSALDQAGWSPLDYEVYNLNWPLNLDYEAFNLNGPSKTRENCVRSIRHLMSKGARFKPGLRVRSPRQTYARSEVYSVLHSAAVLSVPSVPHWRDVQGLVQGRAIGPSEFADLADQSSIFLAAHKKSFVKFLVDLGEDVNSKDERGLTPLHIACQYNVWNVLFLLQHGADIDLQDNLGQTPLQKACFTDSMQSPAIVAVLLKYGAHVGKADKLGRTPLHIAYDSNSSIIGPMLIDAGAPVNMPGFHGMNPLMYAAANAQNIGDEHLEMLLMIDADIHAKDMSGRTVLHHACLASQKKRVKRLLDAGANIEARDYSQQTPLHLACQRSNTDVVNLLLEKQADALVLDYDKNTPFDLAVENEVTPVVIVMGQHLKVDLTCYEEQEWWGDNESNPDSFDLRFGMVYED
jgi:ankyrin repeat protein